MLYDVQQDMTENITALLKDFDAQFLDAQDVPPEMQELMTYISNNTGLLGGYNQGYVSLASPHIMQWYPRGEMFACHNNLLEYIEKDDRIFIPVITQRSGKPQAPSYDGPTPYLEVHTKENWGDDL